MTPSLPTFLHRIGDLTADFGFAIGPKLVADLGHFRRLSFDRAAGQAHDRFDDLSGRQINAALRSIGFMPAATDFRPSRMMACASTVAVVVPSPASH